MLQALKVVDEFVGGLIHKGMNLRIFPGTITAKAKGLSGNKPTLNPLHLEQCICEGLSQLWVHPWYQMSA